MTSNPWDFHEELIDCIACNKKISRLIHLPVQSGDNDVLRKMNRGYTREQYLELIKRIKHKMPDARFGTDIIVGFCGESRKQFANSVSLCKQIDFEIAYIARYSPRPGTVAAKLYEDTVSDAEKKKRWKELDRLVNSQYAH